MVFRGVAQLVARLLWAFFPKRRLRREKRGKKGAAVEILRRQEQKISGTARGRTKQAFQYPLKPQEILIL